MADRLPLLEAQGLGVERGGRQLFSDLEVCLEPGDLVHLRGANGAGKTTLLRMLAGLSRLGFEGKIGRFAPCLYVGHASAVKGVLTPRENLTWHPAGEASGEPARIDAALAQVGLYGFEDTPAAQLSAGQQRRVNLARLYLSARPLWLLDEPFTAIDAQGVVALTERIAKHCAEGGAVLLTSHQDVRASIAVRHLVIEAVPEP